MTKEAVLLQFFGSFGIPAYPDSSVIKVDEDGNRVKVDYPYLTYVAPIGAWEDGEVAITVDIWYYGVSETVPNAKSREISEKIGLGGVVLRCDGGAIWIKRGSPFSQPVVDGADPVNIKRRSINLSAEYFTQN